VTPQAIHRASESSRPLKILLVQPLSYLFSPGGAHKANRRLVQGLAERGHRCWVVAPPTERGTDPIESVLARSRAIGAEVSQRSGEALVLRHRGVTVHCARKGVDLCLEALRLLRDIEPDWTIVSEDSTFLLLHEILTVRPERVVCFAHSPATLPFGPASFEADAERTAIVRRATGILTVSRYMQDYIAHWGGMPAEVVYSPVYGEGPFARLTAFDRGFVTMVNPSAIKGISVFVELARRLPDVPFAAVPTWGATAADHALLAAQPNITLLPAVDDLDQLFSQVRVLVVPSLWGEAFGQIVVEAMLRGVPVLVSDQGGLPESSLGVGTVVPVRRIERYLGYVDERSVPVPIVPEQEVGPWEAALRRLVGDRSTYEAAAAASHAAAERFVAALGIEPYDRYLRQLSPLPSPPRRLERPALREKLAGMSAEKLELLRRRLHKQEPAR
jgi:glycosyltransferase involved in cell wall biosynthesis